MRRRGKVPSSALRVMYNAAPAGLRTGLFHLNATSDSLVLQDGGDRVDDPDIRVGLAVHDHLVLEPHPARDVEEVFLRETVIPAAVPDHQLIGVLLPGSGKLSAGELFHVEITVRVGIGFEIRLGPGVQACERESRCCQNHNFPHFHFSFELMFVWSTCSVADQSDPPMLCSFASTASSAKVPGRWRGGNST